MADSCIGGLSVVKSLWESGRAGSAYFLADYAVNPLGVKSDEAIAGVVDRWLSRAAEVSDLLVIACNTLSIRYHQSRRADRPVAGPSQVVSMVDCLEAMVQKEAAVLTGRKTLIIGTEFTVSQGLYPEILRRSVSGTSVATIAATELERKIARFEPWEGQGDESLTAELRQAIENTDIAILACTCFPMVQADLAAMYPDVVFLDPGAWCPDLVSDESQVKCKQLSLEVTGNAVAEGRVFEYASSYLEVGSVGSIVT